MPRAGCPGCGVRSTLKPARTATPRSRDVATNGSAHRSPEHRRPAPWRADVHEHPVPRRVRATARAGSVVGRVVAARPAGRAEPDGAGLGGALGPPVGLAAAPVHRRPGPAAAAAAAGAGAARAAAAPGHAHRRPGTGTARRPHVVAALQDLPDDARGGQGRRALRGRLGGGADLRARRAPLVRPSAAWTSTGASRTAQRLLDAAVRQPRPGRAAAAGPHRRPRAPAGAAARARRARRSTRTCWWSAGRGPSTGRPTAGLGPARRPGPGGAQRAAPRPLPGAADAALTTAATANRSVSR